MDSQNAAQEWMSLRSQGRGRLSEGDASDFLQAGSTAIKLGLISALAGTEQAAALRDIAARTSRLLRDRETGDEPKTTFIRGIPKLLTDASSREATDARMIFWGTLLRPTFDGTANVPGPVGAAIVDALQHQFGSDDEIVRWSAAQGVEQLPPALAARVRRGER